MSTFCACRRRARGIRLPHLDVPPPPALVADRPIHDDAFAEWSARALLQRDASDAHRLERCVRCDDCVRPARRPWRNPRFVRKDGPSTAGWWRMLHALPRSGLHDRMSDRRIHPTRPSALSSSTMIPASVAEPAEFVSLRQYPPGRDSNRRRRGRRRRRRAIVKATKCDLCVEHSRSGLRAGLPHDRCAESAPRSSRAGRRDGDRTKRL